MLVQLYGIQVALILTLDQEKEHTTYTAVQTGKVEMDGIMVLSMLAHSLLLM